MREKGRKKEDEWMMLTVRDDMLLPKKLQPFLDDLHLFTDSQLRMTV